MQIPNFPTDSLYKFMAIAGLIVTVLCFYFALTVSENQAQTHIRMASEAKIYLIENEILDTELKHLKYKLRELCKQCKCDCFDEKGNIVLAPKITSKTYGLATYHFNCLE